MAALALQVLSGAAVVAAGVLGSEETQEELRTHLARGIPALSSAEARAALRLVLGLLSERGRPPWWGRRFAHLSGDIEEPPAL